MSKRLARVMDWIQLCNGINITITKLHMSYTKSYFRNLSTLPPVLKAEAKPFQVQVPVWRISEPRPSSNAAVVEEPVTISPTSSPSGWPLLTTHLSFPSQLLKPSRLAAPGQGSVGVRSASGRLETKTIGFMYILPI